MPAYDLVLLDGLVFDGRGSAPRRAHVAVRGGAVAAITDAPIAPSDAAAVVDARGRWVMPGFVDIHTHYDAEVEAAPALDESLRHGVTTVAFGSCSLGTVLSSPLDIADMFTRVEAMPYEHVLPLFERRKTWGTPAEYRAHFRDVALGPNVTAFLGHSDLRAAVMGLERAVTEGEVPSPAEVAAMRRHLEDALDAGFLGLSVNTNRWDKLGGDRFRSRPLPSTYARWAEIRALTRVVRARERVFQAIPNISAKYDVALFAAESAGLGRRPPLKTTLVSAADVRSNRWIYRALGALARTVNTALGGDLRWQALPMTFDLFVDGLDAPIFEEFGAGTAALHLAEAAERRALLADDRYRAWFRRQWTAFFLPRVYHRDFRASRIVACPDASVVGRSIADVARARGRDEVSTFLDLCAEHGDALRWYTTVANDRPAHLRKLLAHPDVLMGFSDAGAHLRNMAFYDFPLHLLRMANDAAREGIAFMPVERAVHRLTGEIAQWLGLDAGVLDVGARADLAVVDPAALDASLDHLATATMPAFGGYERMVRRHDRAVTAVVVNGRLAARDGALVPGVGTERGFGRFLAAGERAPGSADDVATPGTAAVGAGGA